MGCGFFVVVGVSLAVDSPTYPLPFYPASVRSHNILPTTCPIRQHVQQLQQLIYEQTNHTSFGSASHLAGKHHLHCGTTVVGAGGAYSLHGFSKARKQRRGFLNGAFCALPYCTVACATPACVSAALTRWLFLCHSGFVVLFKFPPLSPAVSSILSPYLLLWWRA